MRHAHLARIIAACLAFSVALAPVAASAETTGEDPANPTTPTTTPTTPTSPIATPQETPKPAPVIVIRSYSSSVPRLVAGNAFDLTIDLYNATPRRAENVVVSLGAPAAGSGASGAATAGSLAVLGTGNAKFLGALRGQTAAAVTFQVMAGPGTTPGAMTIPVTISFEYEGVRQELDYTIGLLIERDALLSLVTAELPGSVMQGETFDASFEVGNASGFALSGVVMSVEASGATVTDSTLFLGNMEAAATEGIDVTITPEKAGQLEVVLVVTYRDDFGRSQTFRESRAVTVDSAPEPASMGPDAKPQSEPESHENWFVAFLKALFGIGS